MQKGMILLWSGAIVDIPNGWHLCDGTEDTPDLRDKFVVGAGDTYALGDTGGSVNHNHTFTSDSHYHDIPAGVSIAAGVDLDEVTSPKVVTGTTNNGSSLPPYYALAYIMKL